MPFFLKLILLNEPINESNLCKKKKKIKLKKSIYFITFKWNAMNNQIKGASRGREGGGGGMGRI